MSDFTRWGTHLGNDVTLDDLSAIVAKCIESNEAFTDSEFFPPEDKSLFMDPLIGRSMWKCHDCHQDNEIPKGIKLSPTQEEIRDFYKYIAATNPMLAFQMQSNPHLATDLIRQSFGSFAGQESVLRCKKCQHESPLSIVEIMPMKWIRPTDPKFADDITLEYGAGGPWKLFRGSIDGDDVRQGSVGNCWFVGALSILAQQRPDMVKSLFPFEQEFSDIGVYLVRLCKDGIWRNVIIDDYLPCTRNNTLCYTKSARRQLWAPLIEKAAAKLTGCYEGLHAGTLCEAFSLLTGKPTERVILPIAEQKSTDLLEEVSLEVLWTRVVSSHSAGHLIGLACVPRGDALSIDKLKSLGLQAPHAYVVSEAVEVLVSGSDCARLVKVRNPWGRRSPSMWKGRYSNGSSEYVKVLPRLIELEKVSAHDSENHNGTFWMTWEDVCNYFTSIEFCRTDDSIDTRMQGWLPAMTGLGDMFKILPEVSTDDQPPLRLEVTLYQESHAVRGSADGRVDLGCVVLRAVPKGFELVTRVERVLEPEINFELFLKHTSPPSSYYVVPLSFSNQWVPEHRKFTISVRQLVVSNNSIEKGNSAFTLTKESNTSFMIRQAVMQYCEAAQCEWVEPSAGLFYAICKEKIGAIILARNRTTRFFQNITVDTSESANVYVTRTETSNATGIVSFDSVSPLSAQVLQVVTVKPTKTGHYSIGVSLACGRSLEPPTDRHVPPVIENENPLPLLELHQESPLSNDMKFTVAQLQHRATNYQEKSALMFIEAQQNLVRDEIIGSLIAAGVNPADALVIAEEESETQPLG